MEIEILRMSTYFFIYSFFGWILESVYKTICGKKWVNSGFLYGPLCPIYGCGAIIMILFLSAFKNNIFLLFLIGFIILSIWEYFVGWLLEKLFNTKYWDYTDKKFNFKGRICLFNSIVWGVLGVIFIGIIHPLIQPKIENINNNYLLFINIIFIIGIVADAIMTIIKLKSINKALGKFRDISENLKETLEELKELKNKTIVSDIKNSTISKIDEVKEELEEKIKSVKSDVGNKVDGIRDGFGEKIIEAKEGVEEKIKNIEKSINELKNKQNEINIKFYKKASKLKRVFPTMKSEKMNIFFEQEIDEKKLKKKK